MGATTRTGLLTTPLRERFGVCHRLEHYPTGDLARIVERSARILDVGIDDAGAEAIAMRARGTPRVANRLLKRVRDFAQVHGGGEITEPVAIEALEMLEVDAAGLDRLDRELLRTIVEKFDGGPVGLSTLAVVGRRGARHDRGRLRALPAAARADQAHAPRAGSPRARAYEHLGLDPAGDALRGR